jgi:hypothetical protein
MPDKRGDPCGIWFKDIVIPDPMNVKDTKDCVIFKKNGELYYYVCADEKYRSFYAIRMIIRKIWE